MDKNAGAIAGLVAERLREVGVNAVAWDSGGGLVGVGIARGGEPPDELRFFFGTAGDTWAGEVLGERDVTGAVDTGLDAASTDPDRIAAAILRALGRVTVGLADLGKT